MRHLEVTLFLLSMFDQWKIRVRVVGIDGIGGELGTGNWTKPGDKTWDRRDVPVPLFISIPLAAGCKTQAHFWFERSQKRKGPRFRAGLS
jgi:hypothetical protein